MKRRTALTLCVLTALFSLTVSCKRSPTPPNQATDSNGSAQAQASGQQQEQTVGGDVGQEKTGKPSIAVIPKGTTHVFWNAVKRGADLAGEEAGVTIIWKGPLKENDRAQQIQVVQQFIAQHVDGIVLAPLDYKALVAPVEAATRAGIPVVIIDSALEGTPGTDFVSFVATNNRQGGKLAGEMTTDLLSGEGKVVVLRYLVGSASTDERESGFLEAIAESPGIEVVSANRYAGPTAGEAKSQALNMMAVIRQADGIFCPNESSTYGMLLALRQEGLAGKVHFVGFDASPPLVEGLRAGEIDALVVQDPQGMGYKGVRTLLDHLDGVAVDPIFDTGVVLVRPQNVDDPDIQRLLQ